MGPCAGVGVSFFMWCMSWIWYNPATHGRTAVVLRVQLLVRSPCMMVGCPQTEVSYDFRVKISQVCYLLHCWQGKCGESADPCCSPTLGCLDTARGLSGGLQGLCP